MSSRTSVIVGIALVVLLGSGLGVALATPGENVPEGTAVGDHSDNSTVHVSASADVSTPPDIALVHLAVVATGDTAEAARNQVAQDASNMRAALQEIGVDDDRVQTTYFHISAIHEETENGTEIVGYRAAHGFEIEANVSSDELGNRTGTIVDTAVQNGANQVEGIQFTLAEETRREIRQQALERAMENARKDADVLAAAGNLTIEDVKSISTADVGIGPFEFAREDAAADRAGTVVEPGPVQVSATVSVTYRAE